MSRGVLTAGGGHAWEPEVVAALDRPGMPLSVVRRCADIADVLAFASTGQAAACLLAADLRRLDSESVQQLAAFGVLVVAVHGSDDDRAPTRLDRIGVAAMVADEAGSAALIAAVCDALRGGAEAADRWSASRGLADPRWALPEALPDGVGEATQSSGAAPSGAAPSGAAPSGAAPSGAAPSGAAPSGADHAELWPAGQRGHGHSDADRRTGAGRIRRRRSRAADDAAPATGHADSARSARPRHGSGDRKARRDAGIDPLPAGSAARPGLALAIWGPGGAPGRSTVAMGIADQVAAAGRSVLLIDADVYGGILASAYGLLDESPGIAGACRLAAGGRLDAEELAALCWSVGDHLSLLTGIARADRWPEVRPSAIPAVLTVARQIAEVVVVDCAAVLETDEEISFDTMAPRRNGATLAVLDEADVVLVVGSADPPGMERLVRGLAELAAATRGPSPRVVLNRVRRTAASVGDLVAAVRRFAALEPVAFLPEDREACDRAWQRGITLSAVAPRSALTVELARLSRALLAMPADANRRGKVSTG